MTTYPIFVKISSLHGKRKAEHPTGSQVLWYRPMECHGNSSKCYKIYELNEMLNNNAIQMLGKCQEVLGNAKEMLGDARGC